MAKQSIQTLTRMLQEAQLELTHGDAEKAAKILEKLLKPSGGNPNILYMLGIAYGKMGELDKVKRLCQQGLDADPNHHGLLCNIANVYSIEGDMPAALEYYQKALKQNPEEPNTVDNYCGVLNNLGRHQEAIVLLDRLLAKNPRHAHAYATRGLCYAESGQLERAAQSFQGALKLEPALVDANLGMGSMNRFKGDLVEAEKYYHAVLDIDKRNITAYIGLATVKRLSGNHDSGLEIIGRAEELMPEHIGLLTTKANLLEHAGRYDESFELLQDLKKRDQLKPFGIATYADLCRRYDNCDEALELLNQSIEEPATNNIEKEMLHFTAGKLLDKLGRYDDAFAHFKLANESVESCFDENRHLAFADEGINTYTKDSLSRYPRSTIDSSRPIFILGMPRSGSSLTEQILAAHDDVFAAGELDELTNIAIDIKQQESHYERGKANWMANLPVQAMDDYAVRYLDKLATLNSTSRYITDKMPHNFMYIGLISLLFPQARIIHCMRNPLDTVLSIYFQNFSYSHSYASDLKHIALIYNTYRRLMRHWQQVVDIPILNISYEDMVENQEQTTRKLLDFCDLEWHDDVLHFHKLKRHVATASYDQVRKPVYASSRERWRNYEKYLGDVIKILREED